MELLPWDDAEGAVKENEATLKISLNYHRGASHAAEFTLRHDAHDRSVIDLYERLLAMVRAAGER